MQRKNFKYIYGPVSSWRLGSSLGVDLLSGKQKVCSFNCIYCQLGEMKSLPTKRKVYIPTEKIIEEIKKLPDVHIDYITFSGRGEPTLASNLGETIKAIKEIRKEPIAVLTNSSLLYREDVRKELSLADLVAAKLDADSPQLFKAINRPGAKARFAIILKNLKQFSKEYCGKLVLQVMFIKENQEIAKGIARLAKYIHPAEIQLCTPVRPSKVKPLSKTAMLKIKRYFHGMNAIAVYDVKRKRVQPLSAKAVIYRRGRP